MSYYVGVDIGGTKILSILMDADKEIIGDNQIQTDTRSAEHLFDSVVISIETLLKANNVNHKDIAAIGMGLPGLVDSENGIAVYQSNIPWANFPVSERISKHFGVKNITLDNDVAVAAYNEWHSVKSIKTFVYVTISTGIAMTTIVDGKVIRGNGFAGELGQTFFKHNNEYKRLEKIVSGPALETWYREACGDDNLTTKDLFRDYKDNQQAKEIVHAAAELMSVALYQVNSIIDPDTIVFGGSVITHNPEYLETIKKYLKELLLPDQAHILERMFISQAKNQQGARGAVLRAVSLEAGR